VSVKADQNSCSSPKMDSQAIIITLTSFLKFKFASDRTLQIHERAGGDGIRGREETERKRAVIVCMGSTDSRRECLAREVDVLS
jgi:hypothetical protein